MASLSSIKQTARDAAAQSGDIGTKQLAKAVEELCRYVEGVEKLAKDAADDAKRAKRLSRG